MNKKNIEGWNHKKQLKKKNQANPSEPCKAGLNSQTYNSLNSWLKLDEEPKKLNVG